MTIKFSWLSDNKEINHRTGPTTVKAAPSVARQMEVMMTMMTLKEVRPTVVRALALQA